MDKNKLKNIETHSDRLNIGYFGWMNRILQNNKDGTYQAFSENGGTAGGTAQLPVHFCAWTHTMKVPDTDSAYKWQCKLSITSTKKRKPPRLQRCGFSCDSGSDENKLKENMSWGWSIWPRKHRLTEELMQATKHFIHVTIWPCFSPSFWKSVALSCPRTAFDPENTQIKRRSRVDAVQWRDFYSSEGKKK